MSDTQLLCPAQQRAFDQLAARLEIGSLFHLLGGTGQGKTTLLKALNDRLGGAFLGMKDFVEASARSHPLAVEETAYMLILDALKSHPFVMVDDVHLLNTSSVMFGSRSFYTAMLMGLCSYALEAQRKIIFSTPEELAEPAAQRSYSFRIDQFAAEDYATIAANCLGPDRARRIDFEKVFRFAPKLNAHQLKIVCGCLANNQEINTSLFLELLQSQRLASNVHLSDVQTVDLHDLKGVDDVLRQLEIHIVLPLENDALANHFQLRSKRGVLLHGPPGTGKTTVGRALAHRLKGKFFLIDGNFISGTCDFYKQVQQVFEAAMENAPSIIFIDDIDSIFQEGGERGLYRFLLTQLDGLESESAGRICVMMTAMNVGHLPPALVRSGRVELWLEMKLPNAEARSQILAQQLSSLPEELCLVELTPLLAATEGFTGADLKRTVDDAKAICAYDQAQSVPLQPATEYFLRAVETVKANKARYAETEAEAALQSNSAPAGMRHQLLAAALIDPKTEKYPVGGEG